jgi:hypothetical protein
VTFPKLLLLQKNNNNNIMDLASTIIPKSDQTNADDLISGPRTIKITAVQPGSQEQPVSINFEGDNGRPYKPSKSMRRVLVQLWGSQGAAYVGRRLTICRDPSVKFGGDMVGGIKISHASHIPEAVNLMLTETRGKRKPHHVDPLQDEAPAKDWMPEILAQDALGVFKTWWAGLSAEDKKAAWNCIPKEQKAAFKEKLA